MNRSRKARFASGEDPVCGFMEISVASVACARTYRTDHTIPGSHRSGGPSLVARQVIAFARKVMTVPRGPQAQVCTGVARAATITRIGGWNNARPRVPVRCVPVITVRTRPTVRAAPSVQQPRGLDDLERHALDRFGARQNAVALRTAPSVTSARALTRSIGSQSPVQAESRAIDFGVFLGGSSPRQLPRDASGPPHPEGSIRMRRRDVMSGLIGASVYYALPHVASVARAGNAGPLRRVRPADPG